MRLKTDVDIAVAGVFDQITLVVSSARRPVATPVAHNLTDHRVAVFIKSQCFIGTHRCAWQHHVDGGRVSLWCLQRTQQAFSVLLVEDGLLVELVVDRVGKEVATGHEVCGACDAAVADNGNLSCTGWRRCQCD